MEYTSATKTLKNALKFFGKYTLTVPEKVFTLVCYKEIKKALDILEETQQTFQRCFNVFFWLMQRSDLATWDNVQST